MALINKKVFYISLHLYLGTYIEGFKTTKSIAKTTNYRYLLWLLTIFNLNNIVKLFS